LNPTDACQTNANKRNSTGTAGKTSTNVLKEEKAPGNFAIINIGRKLKVTSL